MAAALSSVVASPVFTRDFILQALKSDAGLKTAWIVVEAEDDYMVYQKFMDSSSTVVKTSEGEDGRRGYANVEQIVTEVKAAVTAAHICGIRDTDYTKYEETAHVYPANIFPTDRRDLEMMMLESGTVQTALRAWVSQYDAAMNKITPVCRHLGYLRICNHVRNLACVFKDHLKVSRFWEFGSQDWNAGWKTQINNIFVSLSNGGCSEAILNAFISEKNLQTESFYDICRGHDVLSALSLALINTNEYSSASIMLKMSDVYTMPDFMSTRLYARIKAWQEVEGVVALAA